LQECAVGSARSRDVLLDRASIGFKFPRSNGLVVRSRRWNRRALDRVSKVLDRVTVSWCPLDRELILLDREGYPVSARKNELKKMKKKKTNQKEKQ